MRSTLCLFTLLLIVSAAARAGDAEKPCCPAPPPPPVEMTLRGEANQEISPDEAKLRFYIGHENADLQAARKEHNEQSARITAVLREAAVAEADIRADLSINRKVEDRRRSRTVTGYTVRTEYEVTMRTLDKLDATLDSLIAAGVKEFSSVSFSLTKPEERLKKLRLEAIADARAQAEATAARTGVKLGRLVRISGPPTAEEKEKLKGTPSISGASGLENQYLIGGVNITNTGYGGIGAYDSVLGASGVGVSYNGSGGSSYTPPTVTEEPVFTRPGKLKLQAQVYLTYELADLGRFYVAPEAPSLISQMPAPPVLPLQSRREAAVRH
jgi:uncharacterized protein YggE